MPAAAPLLLSGEAVILLGWAEPVIFPPAEALTNAEVFLPFSPAGDKLYLETWRRFLAANQ